MKSLRLILFFALLPVVIQAAEKPYGEFFTSGPIGTPTVVKGQFYGAGKLTRLRVYFVFKGKGRPYVKKIRLNRTTGAWSFATGKTANVGKMIGVHFYVTGFRGKIAIVKANRGYRMN